MNEYHDPRGAGRSIPLLLQQTTAQNTTFSTPADSSSDSRNVDLPVRADLHPGSLEPSYILPQSTFGQQDRWNSDAQIAARKAMAKRSSRSFSARVSRMRSRRERFGRPTRFGIKVDTSFTRHKGDAPRLVYPSENNTSSSKRSGTVKKPSWFHLGRSGTRSGKGLGITGGGYNEITSPSGETNPEMSPKITTYQMKHGEEHPLYFDPKTADSLTPGTRTWMEISPSDRPIPIGISVPSDSVPDFSPYQTNRKRSESDVTLVTPSIVITPAAIRSVWSPDTEYTESEYSAVRASSIYSRATFDPKLIASDAPPVPAIPATIPKGYTGNNGISLSNTDSGVHARKDTVDSAVTAFEEDDETKKRDRVTSTGTFFEEDETPLTRDKHMHMLSTLSIDTAVVPTPRRSRGWWNIITTPFELSRHNSVWGAPSATNERTPDVPVVPQKFGASPRSAVTPSTYIWSATDRSATDRGDSVLFPAPLQRLIASGANVNVQEMEMQEVTSKPFETHPQRKDDELARTPQTQQQHLPSIHVQIHHNEPQLHASDDLGITSPFSATTASPVLRTAAIDTVVLPNEKPRQIHVTVEVKDQRAEGKPQVVLTPPQAALRSTHPSPAVHQSQTPPQRTVAYQSPPHFDPPPTFPQKSKSAKGRIPDEESIGSSTSSPDLKSTKPRRKANKLNIMDWFGRKLTGSRKKNHKEGGVEKKKRKSRRCCCLWACCCLLLLCLIAVIVPIAIVLSRRHNHPTPKIVDGTPQGGPAQESPSATKPSQWLNLTGYPPIPTGISTVAQPEAVEEVTGCVSPGTIWSCALPKEEQPLIAPNKPDQPNFKLQIVFENGTVADPSKTRPVRRTANAVSAGAFIRHLLLGRAIPLPSPAPASIEEQQFLGQTTDKNNAPFEGEQTPFFISLLPRSSSSNRLAKRDLGNISDIIPPPSVNNDGTAAPANLLPFPSQQPLRLYDRGKDSEHYGFYTYFDRSIFLKSIDPSNSSFGGVPADMNGGSAFDAASLRCTWSQTRFLVQIWTRSQSTKPLLQGASKPNPSTSPENNLKRPGSFPYPVTITLDRHGGTAQKKMIYCYDLDQTGKPLANEENKKFVVEDRSFGGATSNPSNGSLSPSTGPGIDGGSGGCLCQWQNWLA